MAVAISYTGAGSYIGINPGSNSWTGLTLTTSKGLIVMVPYGGPSGTATFSTTGAWALSTDGAPQEVIILNGDVGKNYAILSWPAITAGTQNLSVTNSGSYCEGAPYLLEVTGHDTADMLGTSVAELNGDGFVTLTLATGSALIGSHWGSDTTSLYQGVGGTWNSPSQAMNSYGSVGTSWNVTPNTGSQTVELLAGVAYLQVAIEVKAAASGPTITSAAFSHVAAAALGLAGRGLFPAAVSAVSAITLTYVGSTRKVWRVPTTAANGTAVHVTVFSGASPTYAILAQGIATVDASGYAEITSAGTSGDKGLAFVHNWDDNTATTSIFGGAGIATVP